MSRRILHTMLRVGNVERSLKFYCGVLGMKGARALCGFVTTFHWRARVRAADADVQLPSSATTSSPLQYCARLTGQTKNTP